MKSECYNGYTLVEMLVALAVTSIVLTGTYAAYTLFFQQQQKLVLMSELDRSALVAINLIKSDIQMAGFRIHDSVHSSRPVEAIQINPNNSSDVSFVFDDYNLDSNRKEVPYRAFVRYYLTGSGELNRFYAECITPDVICSLNDINSLRIIYDETLIDNVSEFNAEPIAIKPTIGSDFDGFPQILKVTLKLSMNKNVDGFLKQTNKDFTFLATAKNVSLVYKY